MIVSSIFYFDMKWKMQFIQKQKKTCETLFQTSGLVLIFDIQLFYDTFVCNGQLNVP